MAQDSDTTSMKSYHTKMSAGKLPNKDHYTADIIKLLEKLTSTSTLQYEQYVKYWRKKKINFNVQV